MANRVTKIFEGGFDMKFVIPDVNFLKGCNSSRYDLSGTFRAHKVFVVSNTISFAWTLIMKPQITRST